MLRLSVWKHTHTHTSTEPFVRARAQLSNRESQQDRMQGYGQSQIALKVHTHTHLTRLQAMQSSLSMQSLWAICQKQWAQEAATWQVTCAVCLEEILASERRSQAAPETGCVHTFHWECIRKLCLDHAHGMDRGRGSTEAHLPRTWFRVKASCPICNTSLLEEGIFEVNPDSGCFAARAY